MIDEVKKLDIPFLIAFNKSDINQASDEDRSYCQNNHIPFIEVSANKKSNITKLKEQIISIVPAEP